MLQSIVTRYHGPTNKVESRVSATANAGRVFIKYDPSVSLTDNHRRAATKLAYRYGWTGRYVGGSLRANECVFVADTNDARDSFFAGNNS